MNLKTIQQIWTMSKYVLFGLFMQVCLSSMLIANDGNAQRMSIEEIYVTIHLKNANLEETFTAIGKKTNFNFAYNHDILNKNTRITKKITNQPLSQVLTEIAKENGLSFKRVNENIYVSKSPTQRPNEKLKALVKEIAQVKVSGNVVDNEGQPLPGVNILIKGTANGTTTNLDGDFTLNVPSDATLQFSYIGFLTQEVAVGNQTEIKITLQPDLAQLEEVVVIGYGTQNKEDLTSSVASVSSENFVKGNVNDAGQLLQGKVAGLTVSMPSGDPTSGSQILLRGNTTLFGSNSNPLVLIDGVPGDFKTVAPEDIETIDVLKDGSAAAIYGTRGTNGVIIITTKRAKGEYSSSVDYSANFSTQAIARQLEMFTADDYRAQIAAGTRDASWDLGASTDWMDEITQTPLSQVHNLTFRGGNSTTNYLANINYRDLEGIFLKSNNQTFTGRVDINHNMFNDKLKFNFGILNSQNKFNTTGDGLSFNGYTYRQALIRNPTAPVKDENGDWHEQTAIFNYENPLGRIYESDGENKSQNSRLNSTITYTPIPGLNLSALFSINRYNQTRGYAESKKHISTLRDGKNGFASNGTTEAIDRLMELTASYSTSFGDHSVTLLGGYSYQDHDRKEFWQQNQDFPTDIFSYNNIGLGQALKDGNPAVNIYSGRSLTNLIGFFGRATYSYKDKYLLLASIRHEAASQLYGAEKPWGTFPAVSLGWKISNEAFMENLTVVNKLKLRAGYGVTGSQPSAQFLGVALLSYSNFFYYDGEWIRTLVPSQNPNPDLRWEEKHETNLGLDFSLLNDRFSGSIDAYNRKIDGLLYDYQVPSPPNLYPSTRANVGVMENKGLEVLVNVIPVQTQDFEWMTSVNFSTNSNKLVSLSNDNYQTTNDYFTTGGTGEPIQTFTHMVKIGDNIGDFYGFKVVDIDEDGYWVYEGTEGEEVSYGDFNHSFEEKQVLGNGLPKYYAGWNNNFRYKSWDLSVTMRGAFDYQILNFQRMYLENPTLPQYNQLNTADDKVFGKAVLNAPLEYNSYYVEDGDFWKIDNITLGYNIKTGGSKIFKSARVYISTLNTVTITDYKGIDPEVNRLGLSPGNDDRDKYPTTRTFTAGFNVSF
ncbi:TonB-dependent receptor [Flammeovirgaceae bacterium SG7u.111]|nr:TonB-dependent receptor [Flammeovirgaceae bacterium SG7u.132]WPO36830.1 TonB-dependent receptor [Flammeovirgaceae bacterium SG7u.111]